MFLTVATLTVVRASVFLTVATLTVVRVKCVLNSGNFDSGQSKVCSYMLKRREGKMSLSARLIERPSH